MFDPNDMEVATVDGWFVYMSEDGSKEAVYLPLHSEASLSLTPSEGDFCIVEGPDDNGDLKEIRGRVQSVTRSYRYKPTTGKLFFEIRVELNS